MPQYIPYSIRHNITDKDLAGLLDYCDRETDLQIGDSTLGVSLYLYGKYSISIHPEISVIGNEMDDLGDSCGTIFYMIPTLFFRTYKTLLPNIRDLYSK